jgi:RND family efflux transporter MFP subunit
MLAKSWSRAVMGLVGFVVLVVWSAGPCRSHPEPGVALRPGSTRLPDGAKTWRVQRTNQAARVFAVGTVASENRVNLSSRLGAYVTEVGVSAGETVRKGQVCVVLDDREIREQLSALQAQLKQAETEYERTRQLFEKNAATEQGLVAAESLHNSLRAKVEAAKVMLSDTVLRAPMDGVVTDRRVEAGDLASPGQVLLSVYDSRNMRLEVPVPVRLVEHLARGQDVDVVLDRPSRAMRGRVSEIVSEIDPLSRTQVVKVRILDAGGDILPGTFGRVWMAGDSRVVVSVPVGAVYRVGQLEWVQVVQGSNLVQRLVKTGVTVAEQVEVLSGLDEGDVILVNPMREGVAHD